MNLIEVFEQIKWLPSINMTFVDAIQIFIIAMVLYYITKSVYKTRAWILVKGLMIIGAVYLIICLANMDVLQSIMQGLFSTLMIAIIIMLQPELQRLVEMVGRKRFGDIKALLLKKQDFQTWYSEDTIQEIATSCEKMGAVKTGALIVIERDIPLTDCVESGIKLESKISSQLLINIFEKNTPLHDGAVIVRKNRVESATCYLPLSTNNDIDKNLGTRHRAALGVSETTDCVVVVVSEETGSISVCVDGTIHHDINRSELIQMLRKFMRKSDEKIIEIRRSNSPIWMKVLAPILGVVIWLSVISTNDPITTKVIENIPVTIVNTDVLDDAGQTYTITNGNTISVRVKGRRTLIDNMEANGLIATADFANMSMVYAVPISVSTANGYEDVEIISDPQTMQLKLEEMSQISVKVEANIVGNIHDDYVVVINEMDCDTITVTCPRSIAKTIDKAVLTIDASDRITNFISTVVPVLYDKNGNVISDTNVSLDKDAILVIANVYDVKAVPITIVLSEQDTSGDEYYILNSCVPEFSTIRVAADADTLVSLQEIVVVVDPQNMSDSTNSIVVDLGDYLPEGCYLANDQVDQMTIDLDLSQYKKMQIKLNTTDIKISGYDAETTMATVLQIPSEIVLYYNASLVDPTTITLETLNPTIKIPEGASGVIKTTLTLTDIDGVTITSGLDVQCVLSSKVDR